MKSFVREAKKLSATALSSALPRAPHRELDAGLAAALAEQERDVLGALVAVVHEPWLRAAAGDSHLERVDDELGAQVVSQRPADDAAAVTADHTAPGKS